MKADQTVLVKKVKLHTDLQACLNIRYHVFVRGQQVPIQEELDGLDLSSEHYLLWVNEFPVGTARVRYIEDFAKIERVAILEAYQHQGLGQTLMKFIIATIGQNPQLKKAKLGAQTHAISFYQKLGFVVCSSEYLDAGIVHQDMQLIL